VSTPGQCELCETPGIVSVNGSWFCLDHIDDGFRLTLRGLAAVHGADPDRTEAIGTEMLHELLLDQDDEQ
jgi:hypothetical protein